MCDRLMGLNLTLKSTFHYPFPQQGVFAGQYGAVFPQKHTFFFKNTIKLLGPVFLPMSVVRIEPLVFHL